MDMMRSRMSEKKAGEIEKGLDAIVMHAGHIVKAFAYVNEIAE